MDVRECLYSPMMLIQFVMPRDTIVTLDAGLRELRIPYGKPRNWIPIHKIRLRIGNAIARTVIKAHILTSNDHISNIGTKHAALHYSPDVCKSTFGETAVLSETDIQAAEE